MYKTILLILTLLLGLSITSQAQTMILTETPVWKTLETDTKYTFLFYLPMNAKRVEVYLYQTTPLPYRGSSLMYKRVYKKVPKGNMEIELSFPYSGRFLHVVKVYEKGNFYTFSMKSGYMEQYKVIHINKRTSFQPNDKITYIQ